jgi:hypothetical protein
MAGKRKPKPEITAKCYLCNFFFHSPLIKNDQVHNPRLCVKTELEIHSFSPVCGEFQLAPFFHCDRTNHQIPPALCHRRWQNKHESCNSKCLQRKELLVVSQPAVGILKIRAGVIQDRESPEPGNPVPIVLKKRCSITI